MKNEEWMIEQIMIQTHSIAKQISGLPNDIQKSVMMQCVSVLKKEYHSFETDGELYDESLTRKTYILARKLKERIEKRIRRYGYINILWIVCNFSDLPEPKNLAYAASHGWIEDDISNFKVRALNDGRFAVYIGSPRHLTSNIILKKS